MKVSGVRASAPAFQSSDDVWMRRRPLPLTPHADQGGALEEVGAEVDRFTKMTASTFAPRPSGPAPNPAPPGEDVGGSLRG